MNQDKRLKIGPYEFVSRLITGSGKYSSFSEMRRCIDASGCQMITVAIRRVDLDAKGEESIFSYIKHETTKILPNTAGCSTVKDAVNTALLAREMLDTDLVKLEVIADSKTLYPDNEKTLEAAKELVSQGFVVLPYILDDPILAVKLEEIGCAAVMPLAAPIGSGLGVQNPCNILHIKRAVKIPVIVDAGVGCSSDAAKVMELGCDGVLMNTAIACAKDPEQMALAMRLAVEAGRASYLAGRIPKKFFASASSPLEGQFF